MASDINEAPFSKWMIEQGYARDNFNWLLKGVKLTGKEIAEKIKEYMNKE